ncbi:hypothetical protein [Kutzneria kofuensis]|uniref:NCAIR mutase (PurE)-related protein n=1 Tax=Kutzneria kofuensis TaxID=103725 RepID=A0A7W9KTU5_9PSEU|nr:hypothetical protein [Kutzneria kofuensis]MBB5897859.1 NCAIR mutase (PurE)-related protein [Kutzneria kofuensis]
MTRGSTDAASADLGFARIDLDREGRQGLPEVVYGPGKEPADIAAVTRRSCRAVTQHMSDSGARTRGGKP